MLENIRAFHIETTIFITMEKAYSKGTSLKAFAKVIRHCFVVVS